MLVFSTFNTKNSLVMFCLERNEKPFPSGQSVILGKVVSEGLGREHNARSATFCTTLVLRSKMLSLLKYLDV